MDRYCTVLDTLALARRMHPGQRNSLDALCRRYTIDNSQRELHGALLDAEILADVYLAMTGGQVSLSLDTAGSTQREEEQVIRRLPADRPALKVVRATPDEAAAHEAYLDMIAGRTATDSGVTSIDPCSPFLITTNFGPHPRTIRPA